MDNTDTTDGALLGGDDVASASSSTASGDASLTLQELNEHLGKQFPSKESALKALKDTSAFAVAREEKIAEKLRAEILQNDRTAQLAAEVAALRKQAFYDKNSQYAEYRDLLEKIDSDPSRAVENPVFKAVYEKAQMGAEVQKSRTVLDSNPRIAVAKDSLSKASEAFQGGNASKGEALAVNAVREAFGL
jgi:anion-transporting  ArsA/GET3 family ATPase